MKHTQNKSNGMTRPMRLLAVLLVPAAALILGATAPEVWAAPAIPLDDAEIFIEVNDTDQDAGAQVFLDGEGWSIMTIYDPFGDIFIQITAFETVAGGLIDNGGVTEEFFEGAEPEYEDLVELEEDILPRFPEGIYTFVGETVDGEPLSGKATLTHDLPGAPVIVFPLEDDEVDPSNAVIQWEPVTTQLIDGGPINIVGYWVIVEDEKKGTEFSVKLPKNATQVTVPSEILQSNKEYKFEILALEKSGNRTITESSFKTE